MEEDWSSRRGNELYPEDDEEDDSESINGGGGLLGEGFVEQVDVANKMKKNIK